MSPASGSVISCAKVLDDYFYGSSNTVEALLLNSFETPALLFTTETSNLLTDIREDRSRHIEKISPYLLLTAGILSGFNPCLLAVMAFLASVNLTQKGRRKEMLKITLGGFSTGIFTMHMLAGLSILGTVNFLPELRSYFSEIAVVMTAFSGSGIFMMLTG